MGGGGDVSGGGGRGVWAGAAVWTAALKTVFEHGGGGEHATWRIEVGEGWAGAAGVGRARVDGAAGMHWSP